MRLGGSISLATRRGQLPHARHCARILFSRTQSGSVRSPAACRAPIPTMAASTYVSQSARSGRNMAGNLVTFDIAHPTTRAPRRSMPASSCAIAVIGKLNHHSNSPVALISPPVARTGEVGAAGFPPGRSRETRQLQRCRAASDLTLAPELRRRLRPLEPGRRAPAGSRDAVFQSQKDPRVRFHVLAPSAFRQVHQ